MREQEPKREKISLVRVAASAILGLAGLDLFLRGKVLVGLVGLGASYFLWTNRHVPR